MDKGEYSQKWHTDPLIHCRIRYVWHEIIDSSADTCTTHTDARRSPVCGCGTWGLNRSHCGLCYQAATLTGAPLPFRYGSCLSTNVSPQAARLCDVSTCVRWPGAWIMRSRFHTEGGGEGWEGKRARHSHLHHPPRKKLKLIPALIRASNMKHQYFRASIAISVMV